MNTFIRLRLITIFLFFIPAVSYSNTIHLNNVWITQSGFAEFGAQRDWFYQLDFHLRLNTFSPRFRQNLDMLRIGRRLNDRMDYSVGFGYLPTQLLVVFINEQRIWQQINYRLDINSNTSVEFYNRVEHRWVHVASGISLRNRFKAVVKTCLQSIDICPYADSETFINLNRVVWDGAKTLAQQRSLIGIEKPLSDSVLLRVGYLNQYIWLRNTANLSYDILSLQAAFMFN